MRWPQRTTAERFWAKVDKRGPEECWVWTANRNAAGYGRFKIDEHNYGSHRVAWTLTHGQLPADKPCVLHLCDNPPCCNPAHLVAGTQAENTADRHRKGRSNAGRGEGHGAARLTAAQVAEIRRRCVAGELQREVGASFGITQARVSEIVLRRKWRSVA